MKCPTHGIPLERAEHGALLSCYVCGYREPETDAIAPVHSTGELCGVHGVDLIPTAYNAQFCPACFNAANPAFDKSKPQKAIQPTKRRCGNPVQRFNEEEMNQIRIWGKEIAANQKARQDKYGAKTKKIGNESADIYHAEGVQAEWAVHRWFYVNDGPIYIVHPTEVSRHDVILDGVGAEVKSTKHESGKLIVPHLDHWFKKHNAPAIFLVIVFKNQARLVGWTTVEEFKAKHKKRDLGYNYPSPSMEQIQLRSLNAFWQWHINYRLERGMI